MIKMLSKLSLIAILTLNMHSKGVQKESIDTSKQEIAFAFDLDEVTVIRPKPKLQYLKLITEKPGLLKTIPWVWKNLDKIKKYSKQSDVHGVLDWIAQQRPEFNETTKTGKTIKERIIEITCNGEPIQGTVDILLNLYHQGYPIVIATNQGKKTVDHLIKQGALPDIAYKLIFTSDYTGRFLKKPNPEYYEAFKNALSQVGLSYQKTMFTDDKKENIESAQQLGIDSVQFKNPALLKREIEKRSVNLSNQEKILLRKSSAKA